MNASLMSLTTTFAGNFIKQFSSIIKSSVRTLIQHYKILYEEVLIDENIINENSKLAALRFYLTS